MNKFTPPQYYRTDLWAIGILILTAWALLWFWPSQHASLQHFIFSSVYTKVQFDLSLFFGWIIMVGAMMLPTTVPLISIFSRMTRHRSNYSTLQILLVLGYLAPWTLSGLIFVTVLSYGQFLVTKIEVWLLGPATLIAAGLYQFSSLKYACLKQCRSPLSFAMRYWRGQNEYREAFQLGVAHGVFCLGCCWLLMLTMIVVGIHHLGWMFLLGLAMAIEKNSPKGVFITKPLGILFITWGLLVTMNHL